MIDELADNGPYELRGIHSGSSNRTLIASGSRGFCILAQENFVGGLCLPCGSDVTRKGRLGLFVAADA